MQLIVLGMHRSGTSMLARLMNMMGAYLGPEALLASYASDNEKGFWERADVRDLNDEILKSANAEWNRISSIKLEDLSDDLRTAYQARIREIVLKLDANRPWLLKDPRMCLTLPLWREFLEVPVCIHIVRKPLEVASSLKTRNSFPISFGVALWEKYNISAFNASAGLPRTIVAYEDLMERPIEMLKQLHAWLTQQEVRGLELPTKKEVKAFIDVNLHHERGSQKDQDGYITVDQAGFYESIRDGSILESSESRALSSGATATLTDFEALNELKNKQGEELRAREWAVVLTEEKYAEEIRTKDAALADAERRSTDLCSESVKLKEDLAGATEREVHLRAARELEAKVLSSLQEEILRQKNLRDETANQMEEIRSRLRESEDRERQSMAELQSAASQIAEARLSLSESKDREARVLAKFQSHVVQLWGQEMEDVRSGERDEELDKSVSDLSREVSDLVGLELAARKRVEFESLWQQFLGREATRAELLSLIRLRSSDARQLAGWIEGLYSDVRFMAESKRWKIGHTLGRIAESLRVIPRPPIMADAEAEQWISAYRTWRTESETRYQSAAQASEKSIAAPPAPSLEELRLAVHQREADARYLDSLYREISQDIHRLTQWIEELSRDVEFMETSWRWKLGHTIGRTLELFGILARPPIMAPEEAKQTLLAFQQWRKDEQIQNSELTLKRLAVEKVYQSRWGSANGSMHSSADSGFGQNGSFASGESNGKFHEVHRPGLGGLFDLLIFPIIDWELRIQRPQHLAMELGKLGHRVFYISKTFVSDVGFRGYRIIDSPSTNVLICQLYCPAPHPNVYNETPTPAQRDAIAQGLRNLCADYGIVCPVSLLDLPFWTPIAEALGGGVIVYDCMDLHDGFGPGNDNLNQAERRLLSIADLVVTSADRLTDYVRPFAETVLIRNAAEVAFFSKRPPRLNYVTDRPVVGYYGAISSWFDLGIVIAAARAYPDWDFILVGSTVGCDTSPAQGIPNIKFIGEVPYATLPGWLYSFDVCMIPFQVCELTLHTNPVKIYEYLSAGKPVVAVRLPELELLEEQLHLVSTTEEFVARLGTAMEERDNRGLIESRSRWAIPHTWANRATSLAEAIKDCYPRVSVIVLTYNNLEFTQNCFLSLERFSNYPNWELIIVDNASTDGTRDYLREYEIINPRARVILNDENVGFSAGNNIGLAAASGEYLILLNNDTFVTQDWMVGMVRHLRRDRKLGLLGPVTNNIGNEAKIDINYSTMEEMAVRARERTAGRRGMVLPLSNVAFFCVAMARKTYEKIGPLDEEFRVGFFEDDDYCMRIKEAGLRVGVAEDVFVHHHLSASFNNVAQERRAQIFAENKAIFERKWGSWKPHEYRKPD